MMRLNFRADLAERRRPKSAARGAPEGAPGTALGPTGARPGAPGPPEWAYQACGGTLPPRRCRSFRLATFRRYPRLGPVEAHLSTSCILLQRVEVLSILFLYYLLQINLSDISFNVSLMFHSVDTLTMVAWPPRHYYSNETGHSKYKHQVSPHSSLSQPNN